MSETCIYEMQKIKAQKMHFIYKKKKQNDNNIKNNSLNKT